MIRFDSDYMEGAHPAVLRRLTEANEIQTPGYGEDPFCTAAAARIMAAASSTEREGIRMHPRITEEAFCGPLAILIIFIYVTPFFRYQDGFIINIKACSKSTVYFGCSYMGKIVPIVHRRTRFLHAGVPPLVEMTA